MTDPTQQVVRGEFSEEKSREPHESWRATEDESTLAAPRHASPWSDEQMTSELPPAIDEGAAGMSDLEPERAPGARPRSRLAGMANAGAGTWLGVVLVAAGFGAIFYTWGKVAGVLNVALQLPYVVSGGIVGLALVIVGVTVVDVAVRRQDSYDRQQQLAQMTRTLAELRELFEAPGERPYDEGLNDGNWAG